MTTPLIDNLGLIMTPAGQPAVGDMIMRGPSGGWTTVQVGQAQPGAPLILDPSTGLPTWEGSSGSTSSNIVETLPSPSATWRGEVLVLDGAGLHRDISYLCVELPGSTYTWVRQPQSLAFVIGDGTDSVFTMHHYLNLQFPQVFVSNIGNEQPEMPGITFSSVDQLTVDFGSLVPAANSYNVGVIG